VFFDIVGGEQYDAALQAARPGARFALCGSLSSRLGDFPQPDRTAAEAKGIELLPISCPHTPDQIAAWREHFSTWLSQGRFVYPQTVL
jgi:NADPH:quinone reductase-like Zn-dependent oxidoreductase